jgi:hypothetical protein
MKGKVTKGVSRYLLVRRGLRLRGRETCSLYSLPPVASFGIARNGSSCFRARAHAFLLFRVEIGGLGCA